MQRRLFAALVGLGGLAILLWLGVWQVQRLDWKQAKLAEIEQRIAAAPQALSDLLPYDDADRYAPVAVEGQFAKGTLRMLASRRQTGAVYRIIRPFETATGTILVDTGWIEDDAPLAEVPTQPITLTGNLDWPNEADSFTPAPDLDNNIWFARDVPAMAEHLNTEPILIVLREAPEADIGVTPWPTDTSNIPNDHLQYAITWFSLAAIWAGMTLAFVLRRPGAKQES